MDLVVQGYSLCGVMWCGTVSVVKTIESTIPRLRRKKKLTNFFLVPDFNPQFRWEDWRQFVNRWLK